MKLRTLALALALAVAAAFTAGSTGATAAPLTSNVIPITGTVANATGTIGTFTGNFTLQSIQNVNGVLSAVGTLSGTLTDTAGNVLGTVTNLPITIPLQATGTCQILHLELGPLDLNLLGLMVHLNRVVLDITAQSGPGNLLGNLLCAVAHLLDSNAGATGLAAVLNNLLRALGII
jgi:hypothetical protein